MRFSLDAALPDTPALLLEEFRNIRTLRLLMEKEVAPVKERERKLEDALLDVIPKSGEGVVSGGYLGRVVTKTKPVAEDWLKIYVYVQREARFDLLQKRLSEKAVADMWADGQEVPGVGRIHVPELSITKVR